MQSSAPPPPDEPACINLRRLLGGMYTVTYEESFRAEYGTNRFGREAPWLMIVRCRQGHIYPQSETELAFASDDGCRGSARKALDFAKAPGARVLNQGGDGVNVAFCLSLLPAALVHFGARRKRKRSNHECNEHHQVEQLGHSQSKMD